MLPALWVAVWLVLACRPSHDLLLKLGRLCFSGFEVLAKGLQRKKSTAGGATCASFPKTV